MHHARPGRVRLRRGRLGRVDLAVRAASRATKILVEEAFAPLLRDRDPLDVEQLWREMCGDAFWYGVEGIAAFAISAIDMALWDLKGKLLGQPVAKILPGGFRSQVPVMASIIFDMEDLDWTLNEFRGFVDEGYFIVKAGWGMRPDVVFGLDAERDLRYVREIRGVIGDAISLVVDTPGARGLWDVPTAIRRIPRARGVQPPLDRAAAAPRRSGRPRALAREPDHAGGDGRGRMEPRDLPARDRRRRRRRGPARSGSMPRHHRLPETIKLIEAAGLKYSMHSWSSALNTAASVHLLAISTTRRTHSTSSRTSRRCSTSSSRIHGSTTAVSARARRTGLGVRVRQDIVEKYLLD